MMTVFKETLGRSDSYVDPEWNPVYTTVSIYSIWFDLIQFLLDAAEHAYPNLLQLL